MKRSEKIINHLPGQSTGEGSGNYFGDKVGITADIRYWYRSQQRPNLNADLWEGQLWSEAPRSIHRAYRTGSSSNLHCEREFKLDAKVWGSQAPNCKCPLTPIHKQDANKTQGSLHRASSMVLFEYQDNRGRSLTLIWSSDTRLIKLGNMLAIYMISIS